MHYSHVHPAQITSTANDITSTNNVLTIVFRSDMVDNTRSSLVFSASYISFIPEIGKSNKETFLLSHLILN